MKSLKECLLHSVRLNIHNAKATKAYKTFGQLKAGDTFYSTVVYKGGDYDINPCTVKSTKETNRVESWDFIEGNMLNARRYIFNHRQT